MRLQRITQGNLDERLEVVVLNKMTQNPFTDDVCSLKFKTFSL